MARDIPEPLRFQIASRAEYSCEYCLYPEEFSYLAYQVDHIISRKHGGTSDFANLAYTCPHCNRNKGADVASLTASGTPVRFFNPRQQLWQDHFRLQNATIEPLTEEGRVTVRILKLNDAKRVAERAVLQQTGLYPSS